MSAVPVEGLEEGREGWFHLMMISIPRMWVFGRKRRLCVPVDEGLLTRRTRAVTRTQVAFPPTKMASAHYPRTSSTNYTHNGPNGNGIK